MGIDEEEEDGQSWAFFTLEILARTPSGVTSPTIVTFFDSISIQNDVTPAFNNPSSNHIKTLTHI